MTDLAVATAAYPVLIEPNSPSPGVIVAFNEVCGAPVELMQIDHEKRRSLRSIAQQKFPALKWATP